MHDEFTITKDDIQAELPAVAGREIVHRLTDKEIDEYVNVVNLEDQFEEAKTLILGDVKNSATQRIENWLQTGSLDGPLPTKFDPVEVDAFLRRQMEHLLYKTQFWYGIRMGKKCWNAKLAIAAGWVVVNDGPKMLTE